jgi:hypothetical protein
MIPADHTLVAMTSDWGAYALAAFLTHLSGRSEALIRGADYRRVLHEAVMAGAIDGPSRYAQPRIDGVDEEFNVHLLELMRGAVEYPRRPGINPATRDCRARRRLSGGQ